MGSVNLAPRAGQPLMTSCYLFSTPSRSKEPRIQLCPRHECPCCSVPLYYGIGIGGFLLLLPIHRSQLPALRTADSRGRPSGLEGAPHSACVPLFLLILLSISAPRSLHGDTRFGTACTPESDGYISRDIRLSFHPHIFSLHTSA